MGGDVIHDSSHTGERAHEMQRRVWFFLFFLLLLPALCLARGVPALTGPVVDEAGVFQSQPQLKTTLEEALRNYQRQYDVQLQVLTVSSLQGDNLEDFSIRVADAWKIGDAKLDNGLIILFASQERKVRIEVGQGLEGNLPDARAGRIIQDVMIPAFKQQAYAIGIAQGLQAVAQQLGHELNLAYMPKLQNNQAYVDRGQRGAINLVYVVFLIIIFIISAIVSSRRGISGRGGFYGGGFSGGGGSSGGWSGGGGGFSGGGASGSW